MKANPVGWFEIAVTDLDRAEEFYTELFGAELARQEPQGDMTMSWFPMSMEGYGAAGTLVQSPHYKPSHEGSLVYFSVDNVEKTLEKASAMGAEILFPKTNIGEHGFIAWVQDSEGNRIAIHSMEG